MPPVTSQNSITVNAQPYPSPGRTHRGPSARGPPLPASIHTKVQACRRCHVKKRKCDGDRPRCASCLGADAECDYTWKLPEKYQTLHDKLSESEERIRQLELELSLARSNDDILGLQESISTPILHRPTQDISWNPAPTNTSPALQCSLSSLVHSQHGNENSYRYHIFDPFSQSFQAVRSLPSLAHGFWNEDSHSQVGATQLTPAGFPPHDEMLRIARLFCEDYKLAQHVTTFRQLKQDIGIVYTMSGRTDLSPSASRFRLLIVLFLSGGDCLAYHDADQDTLRVYRERAVKELPELLAREDITCVQVYTFLALLGLYVPDGPDMWQVVGLGLRTAIALAMHRNDDVFLGPYRGSIDYDSLQRFDNHRKNVFWSLYSLDRLNAIVLGRPPGIRDSDIDVQIPPHSPLDEPICITDNFHHGICAHRLHFQIIESLHSCSVIRPATEEAEAIVFDLASKVQVWHASNPLRATFTIISDANIKRLSLTDLKYQSMMMLLFRPSRLVPQIPTLFVTKLFEAATIALQLFEHYCAHKKFIIHWVHLHHAFITTMTLNFCYHEFQCRGDLQTVATSEIQAVMERCKAVLSRFRIWPQYVQYMEIVERVLANASILHAGAGPGQMDVSATGTSANTSSADICSAVYGATANPNDASQSEADLLLPVDQGDRDVLSMWGSGNIDTDWLGVEWT